VHEANTYSVRKALKRLGACRGKRDVLVQQVKGGDVRQAPRQVLEGHSHAGQCRNQQEASRRLLDSSALGAPVPMAKPKAGDAGATLQPERKNTLYTYAITASHDQIMKSNTLKYTQTHQCD
jgi:hypothetical protein